MHHDVDELGDVGLQHEGRHPGSADVLGVDDAVGARPSQFASLATLRAPATMNRSGPGRGR